MRNLAWYISLAITFFGFMMIEFYFTQEPSKSAPHGNDAFIPITILIPFLVLSLLITWTVGRKYFAIRPLKRAWVFLLITIFILFVGITGEYQLIERSLHALHGNWNDSDSVIYGKGAFNFYTNSWYFNENSFLLIHLMAFLLGFFARNTEWQMDEEDKKSIDEEKTEG
ncbi:hypothetical protein [Rummeliibacillus sp. SL167]|uniref:hypothetical protein n=1 Tax=Rummeliibacillus sp. SL167 TaxID=2579792 RepID=UPI0011B5A904|nr:hypothetical protein [Rummeliibacillus sp. SL167]